MERERTSFPRFYFVGDEDLLEIIGNSKNIGRLQKHFKKMFAGVSALTLTSEDTVITGRVVAGWLDWPNTYSLIKSLLLRVSLTTDILLNCNKVPLQQCFLHFRIDILEFCCCC